MSRTTTVTCDSCGDSEVMTDANERMWWHFGDGRDLCDRCEKATREERMRALEESLERLRAMPDEEGAFGRFLDGMDSKTGEEE